MNERLKDDVMNAILIANMFDEVEKRCTRSQNEHQRVFEVAH